MKTDVISTRARKGSLLIARSPEINGVKKAKTGVLLMNNVFGNLAAGEVMTNFVGNIARFCSSGGKMRR